MQPLKNFVVYLYGEQIGFPNIKGAQVPEKEDFFIDLVVILAAGTVGLFLSWGVAIFVPGLLLALIIDVMLTFVLGSVAYYTSFVIKEKKYGTTDS